MRTQNFFIDTAKPQSGECRDATFILPQGLLDCAEHEEMRLTLNSLSITKNWYDVNKNNSVFYVVGLQGDVVTTTRCQLEFGNYLIKGSEEVPPIHTSLCEAVENSMKTALAHTHQTPVNSWSITATYDKLTELIVIHADFSGYNEYTDGVKIVSFTIPSQQQIDSTNIVNDILNTPNGAHASSYLGHNRTQQAATSPSEGVLRTVVLPPDKKEPRLVSGDYIEWFHPTEGDSRLHYYGIITSTSLTTVSGQAVLQIDFSKHDSVSAADLPKSTLVRFYKPFSAASVRLIDGHTENAMNFVDNTGWVASPPRNPNGSEDETVYDVTLFKPWAQAVVDADTSDTLTINDVNLLNHYTIEGGVEFPAELVAMYFPGNETTDNVRSLEMQNRRLIPDDANTIYTLKYELVSVAFLATDPAVPSFLGVSDPEDGSISITGLRIPLIDASGGTTVFPQDAAAFFAHQLVEITDTSATHQTLIAGGAQAPRIETVNDVTSVILDFTVTISPSVIGGGFDLSIQSEIKNAPGVNPQEYYKIWSSENITDDLTNDNVIYNEMPVGTSPTILRQKTFTQLTDPPFADPPDQPGTGIFGTGTGTVLYTQIQSDSNRNHWFSIPYLDQTGGVDSTNSISLRRSSERNQSTSPQIVTDQFQSFFEVVGGCYENRGKVPGNTIQEQFANLRSVFSERVDTGVLTASGEYPVSLQQIENLFLRTNLNSENFQSPGFDTGLQNNIASSQILAKIPVGVPNSTTTFYVPFQQQQQAYNAVSVPVGKIIYYTDNGNNMYSIKLTQKRTAQLRLFLTDKYGRLIDPVSPSQVNCGMLGFTASLRVDTFERIM